MTVGRPAASLLVVGSVVMLYTFLYELTKESPLSTATTGDLVTVAAYAVLLVALVTAALLPIAVLVDVLLARRGVSTPVGTHVCTALVAGVGIVTFVENLLYSAAHMGLKTDDGIPLKILYGVLGVALGLLAARALSKMTPRTVRRVLVGAGVLALVAAGVVGVYLMREKTPDTLQASGDQRLVNVVVLSSDGIDARRMSVYGYRRDTTPFLRTKANEFRVFDDAFTNNGNTTGSITALLTGMSPLQSGVVYPPDRLRGEDALRSLPRLLGGLGYYRANWAVPHYADAHEQNLVDAFDDDNGTVDSHSPTRLLPLGVGPARWFVDQTVGGSTSIVEDILGIDELPNPYSSVSVIAGDTISDHERLDRTIATVRDRSRFFVNVHFMVSHGPLFKIEQPRWSVGEKQTTGWQRDPYDDSVREFDGYVRQVYEALRDSGKLDDTVLVITSDHGIEYNAAERVPLLIRFPSASPSGRVDQNVQRIDVAPTLLDVMNIARPSWMTGSSLLDLNDVPADRQIVATTTATREFPGHLGYRPPGGALVLTTVRCRSYAKLMPSGEVERGSVKGSTARCSERPDPARETKAPTTG